MDSERQDQMTGWHLDKSINLSVVLTGLIIIFTIVVSVVNWQIMYAEKFQQVTDELYQLNMTVQNLSNTVSRTNSEADDLSKGLTRLSQRVKDKIGN